MKDASATGDPKHAARATRMAGRQMRSRLLDAASRLFRERGLAAVSIADIAAWPWVLRYDWQGQKLEDFPNVKRWFEAVGARPAVQRGAAVGADLMAAAPPPTDEDKKRLFGFRDKDLK